MFKSVRKSIKNLIVFSFIGVGFFMSNVQAEGKFDLCKLINATYEVCQKNLHNDKNIKSLTLNEKRKVCDIASISFSIDMFMELSKRYNDVQGAKNVSILTGLVCKDACLGTDIYYSVFKKESCK